MQGLFWSWTRTATSVVHVDLHSGLGAFGDYQLFVEPVQAAEIESFRTRFVGDRVVSVADGETCSARGVIGTWLARHAGARRYHFVCAEFGTYAAMRMLAALRAENRAGRLSQRGHPAYARAARKFVECFCPASPRWRRQTVAAGVEVIQQAVAASAREQGER